MRGRVLIIDAAARGQAVASAHLRSGAAEAMVAPGNPGMAELGVRIGQRITVNGNCTLTDTAALLSVAREFEPDIVEVTQDDALAAGTVDVLREAGFYVFGPTRAQSRIEWDKAWARDVMRQNGIPAPRYRVFDRSQADEALRYAKKSFAENPDLVLFVKAYGLLAGKGALKATSAAEVQAAIARMAAFGPAGETFVLEDALPGEECSFFALTDGETYRVFPPGQDNKRVFDGDHGDQTGGMGVVVPTRAADGRLAEIEDRQVRRLLDYYRTSGDPYQGVVYVGCMVGHDEVGTVEYNARWGDPEAQAILPGVHNYHQLIEASLERRLAEIEVEHDGLVRVCISLASKGYPGDYSAVKEREVTGIDQALAEPDVELFSYALDVTDGRFYANGGRLLSVVGSGKDLPSAHARAYAAAEHISIAGDLLHYRRDIGWRDMARASLSAGFSPSGGV